MSFFGGTECSTGNVVAQLNKHTQQDRSLQRQTHSPAPGAQSFKQDKMVNQRDLEQFSAPATFQFQPVRHELNRILSPLWASEFPQFQNGQSQEPGFQSPSFQNASFQQAPQQKAPTQQAPQLQMQGFQLAQPLHLMPLHLMPLRPMQLFQPRFGLHGPQSQMGQAQNSAQETKEGQEVSEAAKEDVDWDQQFSQVEAESDIVVDDKYQATFDEVWELLNLDATENDIITQQYEDFKHTHLETDPADLLQWEKDFARYASTRAHFGEYQFESAETNQFTDLPADQDPYQIGLQLMASGARLSEAALAFEAAIAKNPNHVDAWLKLGEVQTQNEKEVAGIAALEKCLQLEGENGAALMTLAISYINEGYDNAAFATLERWISTKYPEIANEAREKNPTITDEDRFSVHRRVTELFIQAAQLSPDHANMDADVQMGLGVLFYANEDFDKTIDCFRAALSIRPNDAVLWNRLGASLANLNRPEEAVTAYFKALELQPTFVRARYNLGVLCINIGCYKEAAEHLLLGLAMHEVEGQTQTLSHNQLLLLMETLKRAFIAMDRRDLLEKVKPGMNLADFRGEFTF